MGFVDPSLDRGDRACIHLKDVGGKFECAIYEDRPDFCRLDPKIPVPLQTRWCDFQQKNWPLQVEEQEIRRDIHLRRG